MKKRLFVAIDMPPDIVAYLQKIQRDLDDTHYMHCTFVPADHLHVTLSFIGDVDVHRIPELIEKLRTIKSKPIKASLGTLGVFPSHEHISIIWDGLNADGLSELAHSIDQLMAEYVNREPRTFVSHITLARVISVAAKKELNDYLTAYQVEPHAFTITEFALKESVLTSHGAVHTTLEKFNF